MPGNEYAVQVESTKCTSQKIKETVNDSGDSISEYSADIIAKINTIPIIKSKSNTSTNNLATLSLVATSGGTEEQYAWDQTSGIEMYVKVTYESGTMDSYSIYKVTSASGKLVRVDSFTSLTNISINQYIRGTAYSSVTGSPVTGAGSSYNCTASADYPSNNTYYNHTALSPYAWKMGDGSLSITECIVTGNFKRGTSTWSGNVTWSKCT